MADFSKVDFRKNDGSMRFGHYELLLDSEELRKDGNRLKLAGQAIQVLVVLATNSGQLVTREELQQKLWPGAAYGDFEHGLNAAVNRLRETLGDSATDPKYIETVPRRGYRFIADLNTNTESHALEIVTSVVPTSVIAGGAKARSKVPFVAGAGALCLVVAAWWLFSPVPQPRVTGSTQITHDGLPKGLSDTIATDGPRVYVTEGSSGLAQVSALGGESSEIPTELKGPKNIVDISPDHSQLLVQTVGFLDAPFWTLALPTGAPRRLGNLVAREAHWSPDGRQFVFTKGPDIYLANADGTEPQLLVSVNGIPFSARFSPDGSRIRFTLGTPSSTFSLWEMNANGSKLHQLLAGWHHLGSLCCGRWTPDGRYYIFGSGSGEIFALRESGGFFWHKAPKVPTRLATGPIELYDAVPSTDGRKLFVVGTQSRSELVRYDAGTKQFLPFLAGVSAHDVAFSRDGEWIAYSSTVDSSLWRSRVDGSERLQLTYPPGVTSLLSWSPDGTQIAYSGAEWGKPWKIFLVSAQGGPPEELLPQDTKDEFCATWSPDGARLAFSRDHSESGNIQIVDIKTRQASTLPGSKGLWVPRWSPQGRYLTANNIDLKKLMLYDFKTQKWSDWVTDQDFIDYPSWSSDGRYVYYDNAHTDHTHLHRVMVGSHRSEELYSLDGLRRYEWIYGSWSGQAPDNSRLFLRDTSVQEIYALDVDFP